MEIKSYSHCGHASSAPLTIGDYADNSKTYTVCEGCYRAIPRIARAAGRFLSKESQAAILVEKSSVVDNLNKFINSKLVAHQGMSKTKLEQQKEAVRKRREAKERAKNPETVEVTSEVELTPDLKVRKISWK